MQTARPPPGTSPMASERTKPRRHRGLLFQRRVPGITVLRLPNTAQPQGRPPLPRQPSPEEPGCWVDVPGDGAGLAAAGSKRGQARPGCAGWQAAETLTSPCLSAPASSHPPAAQRSSWRRRGGDQLGAGGWPRSGEESCSQCREDGSRILY